MSEDKPSQADMLVYLALSTNAQLFTDQYANPYIRYDDGRGVLVTYSLKSGIVKDWLAGLLWKKANKAPGSEAVNSALSILRAKAREGPSYQLYNRVAPDGEGGILIDMANDGWNVIRVTSNGWSVESTGQPTFQRHNHMKALPTPIRGGDPFEILRFVNLRDEKDRLLYVIAVISYLIPSIQHVVLIFHGSHGSGKSISMRALRAIIDPSSTELLTIPRNDRELVQQLYHHYCAFYDNLSSLPDWQNDALCRAVTGIGNTKRALYSDDDDFIYAYKRCIGLNGINIVARRGDLLDRGIILYCEMLENSNRAEEKELLTMLEAATPKILGGMLDTIVKALNIYPTIQLEKLYRMADFTRWGCAIAEALNIDKTLFLEAYEENIRTQSEETLKASLIATVLLSYMDMCPDGWRGSPSVLYNILCGHADDLKVSTRQKAWPRSADWMIRRLNEVKPSLYKAGWLVESDREAKTRTVTVRKTSENSVDSVISVTNKNVPESNDTNDATDTTFQSYSGLHIPVKTTTAAILKHLKQATEDSTTEELAEYLHILRDETFKILTQMEKDGFVSQPVAGLWRMVL